MTVGYPAYLALHRSGELAERTRAALELLSPCRLCPRACGVDRRSGERGDCGTGSLARVAAFHPHDGEERPLSGWRGSGTVFFSGCNLNCDFCQNADISQGGGGDEVSAEALSRIFLAVEEMGCHNLNLVTPTHVTPQILEALALAVERGFRLPLVYNCGGYESLETLRLLDGVVDIYLPDLKFSHPEPAGRLCSARDYPERARAAIREMHRQVGELELVDGLARRGLMVRHLVMPSGVAGTREVAEFLAELSCETYFNVMDQYRPCLRAYRHSDISRRTTVEEYREALDVVRRAGLRRLNPG